MYFTNLLSQDPQLDSTYGGQSGSSPMTLGDSPPLPPNEPIGVRKSVRGANFTPEEDKLLVSAWLNCSLDAFDKAKVMYQSLEKCTFQFEYCWHLLKDQPKWIWRATKEDPKRRKTMSLSPTPTPTRCSVATEDLVLDLETENVIENEVIELDRPMGRKAEKGKRKAQGRQAEENFQLRKMKYTMLEESRTQEKEFYRLKAEKMEYDKEKEEKKLRLEDERLRLEAEKTKIEAAKEQSKIRQEDERLRLEAEKVELAKKESDQRIMMMNVSVMPEM
ncbi:hypothetical protein CIPAW_10G115900 [Carya illinoinensis]|uniref:No apical meristem-associated C-terminal domain-containing protein n=1 Tax=Carya illinoinensis TaxID=32201 RepID=A0A8T1PD72_CARIL|nr:hypothetical protein CIPAW_10G115900 [Carya illinoinensis]